MDKKTKTKSTNFSDHYQKRDINEVFYSNFRTQEDAELIRDPSIATYKNVIHQNLDDVYRLEQIKFGFILPKDI